MPSPVAHMIAGAAVALGADQRLDLSRRWRYVVPVCALIAASPDLDLLYPGTHRMATHSVTAVALMLLAAMAVTARLTGRVHWRMSVACALAYGTHLLADYLGADPGRPPGLQLFWPWSREWLLSDWTIFLATERKHPLSAFAISVNTMALARELLLLGPVCLVLWLRRRRLTQDTAGDVPGPRRTAHQWQ